MLDRRQIVHETGSTPSARPTTSLRSADASPGASVAPRAHRSIRRKCSLTLVPIPRRLHRSKPVPGGARLTERQGDGSAAALGRSRSLPAVAEADAEDTGSAAESANRALHHLRNLGNGRPGLRMRLQRAHVFFRPWLDDATCRLRLHSPRGLRALNSLIQSSRHYFRYSI